MEILEKQQIDNVLNKLINDSKNDYRHMIKGIAKAVFRPIKPEDFKDAYLAISRTQGEALIHLIYDNNIKNIVEFGTSFGISTLFLAKGVIKTGGQIITTELIDSKAEKAVQNFKKAGVDDLIDLKIGDAMETLNNHNNPIDLLLLDGWKDLYLSLFKMLEPNFHAKTIIYVDNADMAETQKFLKEIRNQGTYAFQQLFNGKVVLISVVNR